MNILVTGTAGFIGFHLARRFLDRGDTVLGIDNLNNYYDPQLKRARLAQLEKYRIPNPESRIPGFVFLKMDISDRAAMEKLFAENAFDRVVHMAAQAGVRYSFENPHAYVESNVMGFLNVLEGCRRQTSGFGIRDSEFGKRVPSPESRVPVFIYASSSSVYGGNTKLPFSTSDAVDKPISLYAATKRADELMAHTYSHLYGMPATGLRFFTVYGPWGRPDMALFKFTKAILNDEPIDVYGEGRMKRDFTYIDDVVEVVIRVTDRGPGTESRDSGFGIRDSENESRVPSPESRVLYNIGNHSPVLLTDFIREIENALGKKARMNFLPMQPGDVPETYADVNDLARDFGFAPKTPLQEGIGKFVEWYMSYYK